jgi:hypothetical protein
MKKIINFLILILILFLIIGCSKKENYTEINVDNNGIEEIIKISKSLNFPLSYDDALLINNKACGCRGDLINNNEFWESYCCEDYPDCHFKVNINSGQVSCSYFG